MTWRIKKCPAAIHSEEREGQNVALELQLTPSLLTVFPRLLQIIGSAASVASDSQPVVVVTRIQRDMQQSTCGVCIQSKQQLGPQGPAPFQGVGRLARLLALVTDVSHQYKSLHESVEGPTEQIFIRAETVKFDRSCENALRRCRRTQFCR